MFVGKQPARTDSLETEHAKQLVAEASYLSRSASHKVVVYAHEGELRQSLLAEGATLVEDYGGFSLLRVPSNTLKRVNLDSAQGSGLRDDMNLIFLRAGVFDTTEGEPRALRITDQPASSDRQLYLVQMAGPVKDEWLDRLKEAAEIVSYIPNNAYLVRANSEGLALIDGMKSSQGSFIQWSGDYKPAYKIAPEIPLALDKEITVNVQLVTGEQTDEEIRQVASLGAGYLETEAAPVLGYTNIRLKANTSRLREIAQMPNVTWIEPYNEPELLDERQNLILEGAFTGSQLGPPNYMQWLQSKGLASTPDFIVDVADSGMDRGKLDPDVLHPDFLNGAGLARVAYARLVGTSLTEGTANDTTGHGTINAAIVGGYNTGSEFPHVDAQGYSYGLGVHPYVKLGVTKVFNPTFTSPNYVTMIDKVYSDGARVSSNSWGAVNNNYTIDAQTYDSLVRDAQRTVPGNQEMTILFASGNAGHGKLASPGTGKNVITVGASENIRPTARDGCGVNPDGADDAMSMVDFSSGGLTVDGRVKPDIVAPGTHVQGARSQDQLNTGGGVCGPLNFPSGQTLYTWSSGTSHSAPAVAGAAALVRHFFQNSTGTPPSPAMIKAFLTNSSTYMTGALAGGNLPATTQGWGLVNLGRALDETPRISADQTQVLASTGQTVTLRGSVADSTRPFRVTLAWTDAPGSPVGAVTVNNLDLQVSAGGKTYLGNRFAKDVSVEGGPADKVNNVESVWLPAGLTGDFEIRIVGTNIAGDGVPNNSDTTDQDFAVVIYNARSEGSEGGDGPIDSPPSVKLNFPVGGERLTVGNSIRILWDASDNKEITSQRVEFSSDGGATYNTIATLDGNARSFDWKIPAVATTSGRIKVTALDGVNLPVASVSFSNFEVVQGPPDTSPPSVLLLTPNIDSVLGGGLVTTIRWKESDNVGVIQRVIEFSQDAGQTFQKIIELSAPSSGEEQSYSWQVPVTLNTSKGRVRITVYDGAGNAAAITSVGKFEVWPMPIITDADFDTKQGKNGQLEVFGRNFRLNQTEVYVDGRKLKKVKFTEKCDDATGTCKKVSVEDKKVHKRVPVGTPINIRIRLTKTGQESPDFEYKRKKND